MEGLHELPDQTVRFDKPEGHITEAVALIEGLTQREIEAFYAQTLPQFGWRSTGRNIYARQAENLALQFESFAGQNYVRVMVSPQM